MSKLTKAELKDLESVGYVEGDFSTFPENVDPALKARAMEAWKAENPGAGPYDLPDPLETQNEFVRIRAAADGDKAMQDYLGIDENGVHKDEKKAKRDPLDHDNDGRKGGAAKPVDNTNSGDKK